MIILDWRVVGNQIRENLKKYFSWSIWQDKYVAVIFLWNNDSCRIYVWHKKKFGESIWINVKVFWPEDNDMILWKDLTLENILATIDFLNKDDNCVGIVMQLPLTDELVKYKSEILSRISTIKDIDWLWWKLLWLWAIDLIEFIPATPMSVVRLLEYYGFGDFKGKKISILWQSNLVWKPLAMEIIKRWWEVFSFNHFIDKSEIQKSCKLSDYIISATWSLHLVDDSFIRDDQSQILVDVGWWFVDGKPAWDVFYDKVKDKIKAISPVPGGVGPLTVACLFDNIRVLHEQKDKII